MLILMLSVIVWWAIDQAKRLYPVFKLPDAVQKIVTVVLAVGAGAGFAFGYHLDLLVTLGLYEQVTIGGKIMAMVAIAAGSSAVFELTQKLKTARDDIKIGGSE